VRLAVKDYLARLDADDVSSLYSMVINEVERPLIQAVMEQCGQNQSKAAQMLGLSRSTLRKKIAFFTHHERC
jgi:Fis family transcriptional regulator